MKNYKKIIMGILIFIIYIIVNMYISNFLNLFGFNKLPIFLKLIVSLLYDLLILMTLVFVYLKKFIFDLKDFKKNFKHYFNNYFKFFFLNIGLMMIANIIISSIIKVPITTNQKYVEALLMKYPIYAIISASIIAPITEEMIFRLNFKTIFNNNIVFIIVSGLVFGIMHFTSATSMQELLYIIPYSIPGFIFAYTFAKSDNIFAPISLHMMHNILMIILSFIIR